MLHEIVYSLSLTNSSCTMLYLFTIKVIFNQIKILMFYNGQTTNYDICWLKNIYTRNIHSIVSFQIVSDNKQIVQCSFYWEIQIALNFTTLISQKWKSAKSQERWVNLQMEGFAQKKGASMKTAVGALNLCKRPKTELPRDRRRRRI